MRAPIALLLVTASSLAQDSRPASQPDRIRGITISTHGNGRDWGSDAIVPTMKGLKELGASWVAIHPYAPIAGDGSVRFRDFDPAAPPVYLVRPIKEAHALGLKILVIPHLAEWGSPFKSKSEIGFQEKAQVTRFFEQYTRFVEKLARACGDADLLSVGCELDRTTKHDAEWRALIKRVRAATKASLTYAANWSEYERVPFWDALDEIGIQAYFPLCEKRDPSADDLAAAWRARMGTLAAFGTKHKKKLVFTELGYNRSHDAASRPWQYRTDGLEAEPLQLACMRAALAAIESEPAVLGAFLWKWFVAPREVGRDFQLATPEMQDVIRAAWQR